MSTKNLEGAVAVRLENFLALMHEFHLHEMPEEPERGLLKAFSERVGVSDRYLSHVKNGRKRMGPSVARKIEQGMNKPVGWLDRPQGGPIIADNPQQKADLELFQTLLRAEPDEARHLMTEFIKSTLDHAAKAKKSAKPAAKTGAKGSASVKNAA